VGVEGDAVDDGGDQAGVGEDGAPFTEGQVGGDGDAGPFLAFGDDLEEEFGAAGVDLDVAEFVEAEQVQAGVAAHDAGQLAVIGCFDQFVDQVRGGDVADAAALFAGGQAQPDEQVRLPGPGVPEQDDGFTGVEVGPGGQGGQRRRADGGDGVDVELGQAFQAWEAGFGDAPGAASFVAFVDLGAEDLGEVGQVGLAFAQRDLGQGVEAPIAVNSARRAAERVAVGVA
jgi:hypothetical protein